MFGWCGDYPRLVAPYLASLDYQLSETMLTDEIVVKIGGVEHVIFTTMCEGTRAPTGYQIGRKKGPTTSGSCSAWTFWSGRRSVDGKE